MDPFFIYTPFGHLYKFFSIYTSFFLFTQVFFHLYTTVFFEKGV
jgi:hypothetical protein